MKVKGSALKGLFKMMRYVKYLSLILLCLGVPTTINAQTTDQTQKDLIRQIALEEQNRYNESVLNKSVGNEAVQEAVQGVKELRKQSEGETFEEYVRSLIDNNVSLDVRGNYASVNIIEVDDIVVIKLSNVRTSIPDPGTWLDLVGDQLKTVINKRMSWQLWYVDGTVSRYLMD